MIPSTEQALLLALARESVRRAITGAAPLEVEGCRVPPALQEPRACFVTLTRGGQLRGCIGTLEARRPLWQAVVGNARTAATRDSRFAPVSPTELPDLEIEVSVLTPLEPLDFRSPEELLARLVPGRDGVCLEIGPRRATFLPQVWEKLPDKERFLEQLALKAGTPRDAWRQPGARVLTYRVEHFHETAPDERPDTP